MSPGVGLRDAQGHAAEVGGGHLGRRLPLLDGQRHGATARPQVHHRWAGAGRPAFERPTNQDFGFRSGHQDIGIDGQRKAAKLLFSHHIGQRFALGPSGQGCWPGHLGRWWQQLVVVRQQPGSGAVQQMAQQQLGVQSVYTRMLRLPQRVTHAQQHGPRLRHRRPLVAPAARQPGRRAARPARRPSRRPSPGPACTA